MLSGWSKYKNIDLPETTTEQTDLNFRIVVTKEDDMQDDFADIRFTDNDGETLLPQFRESYVSGVSPVWWIKVPLKTAAGQPIWMYYGNDGAELLSDGEDVFELFDDFTGSNGDPPDPTKWTINAPGSCIIDIQSNELRMCLVSGIDIYCVSNVQTYISGWGVKIKFMNVGQYSEPQRWLGFFKPATNSRAKYEAKYLDASWHYWKSHAQNTQTSEVLDKDVWHEIEIRVISNTKDHFWFDNANKVEHTGSEVTDQNGVGFLLWTAGYITDTVLRVDYCFIFKLPDDGTEVEDPEPGEEHSTLVALFEADKTDPTAGQIVKFTDNSIGAITGWLWEFGDGNTSQEQHSHHIYLNPGVYTVSLTVYANGDESKNSKEDYITVGEAEEDTVVGGMLDDIAFRIGDPHFD